MFQKIDSLDLPELEPYRTMRRSQEQKERGIFVAEGEKVVRRLLESNLTVVSLLVPEKWAREYELVVKARKEKISVFIAEKKLLETLTGFSMYQGVLAVAKIPASTSLGEILARVTSPRLFVATDNLTSAENMGALVRNCAAFGVQALILGETCVSPYLRRAVRNSMGTVFHLPVIEPPNLVSALLELRTNNFRCVAADPHSNVRVVSDADFTGDCCILFGSEGYGISPAVLATCDESVAIPMAAKVDSLNVGSAAAVFLYEANRQRKE